MKKYLLCVVLTVISVSTLAQTAQGDERPKISVEGESVVYVKPDRVVIRLGVETQDKDLVLAKQKHNTLVKNVLTAVKQHAVPEREIQSDLSIEPRWDNHSGSNFLGYVVRTSLVVTLTDSTLLETIVTKVLQAGVNRFDGIEFQTAALKQYREQARELALKAAKEKAEKMAAVLGQSIGAPIFISEGAAGDASFGY